MHCCNQYTTSPPWQHNHTVKWQSNADIIWAFQRMMILSDFELSGKRTCQVAFYHCHGHCCSIYLCTVRFSYSCAWHSLSLVILFWSKWRKKIKEATGQSSISWKLLFPFNSHFSRWTWVSKFPHRSPVLEGKPLGNSGMGILQGRHVSCHPAVSVKALKETQSSSLTDDTGLILGNCH